MRFKKIGIIGGMGPESTALLYKYIIALCQQKFRSFHDADFPEIIIHSLPVSDITNNMIDEESVKSELCSSLLLLEKMGVEVICFPCNTLSYFVDYLRKKANIPIIDIVEETAEHVNALNLNKVVLFATETTEKNQLYEQYLGNCSVMIPEFQGNITTLIYQTMKGRAHAVDLEMLTREFIAKSEYVILGCTELSVLAENFDSKYVIDSLRILANSVIEHVLIDDA